MAEPLLAVTNLETFYGPVMAIRGVSFEVPRGDIVTILGANGAGKTTILKTVSGVMDPQKGTVTFAGREIQGQDPDRVARLGLSHVPEGREVFPLLTVRENLESGYAPLKRAERNIPGHVFELFPVLKQMLSRRGGDLSGGQQQQLAIGRALVLEPSLLILDEPTEGIQPNIVHEIGDILLKLNRETGVTMLLVEQKLPFARRVADEFCILEKGRCVAGGPIHELTDEVVHAHLSV